jgi:membrane protease YdiL (CAAX protease family)
MSPLDKRSESGRPPRSAWPRIATFVAVTYGVGGIFMALAISRGEITALTALGGMWSPFAGLLVTRLVFPDGRRRGSLTGLGWGWGRTRYQLWSYALPILYVGATYAAVWLIRAGTIVDTPPGVIARFVLTFAVRDVLVISFAAFGEEVGWQGFLVPELFRTGGFTKAALLRGIIWSVWHFPLILGGVYGTTETSVWYRLACFTVTMTGVSFAFAWLRLKSGSLWTGVFLHAGHNSFIQTIFPGITNDAGGMAWLVDEVGVFTAFAAVVVAVVFWRKRGELAT